MYIPADNRMSETSEIIAFIKRFSFGALVSARENQPVATHLPFVVDERGGDVFLTGHLAWANPQWRDIEEGRVLVIFSEPQAYISPAFYDQRESVPTWNYMAVHAYGKVVLIEDENKVLALLESAIDTYEAAYRQQWSTLSREYKLNMLKGIVAFEIKVTEWQAKKKLSQNKNEGEKQRIIAALSASGDSHERYIADYMKKEFL